MHAFIINEKEVINLWKIGDGYAGGTGERKEKKETL